MNPHKTPIELLKLQGSGNLRRALKREEREKLTAQQATVSLSKPQEDEILQLDNLIARALSACKCGQTFRKKKNPAFANLSALIKARKLLLDSRRDVAEKPLAKKREGIDALNDILDGRTN